VSNFLISFHLNLRVLSTSAYEPLILLRFYRKLTSSLSISPMLLLIYTQREIDAQGAYILDDICGGYELVVVLIN
jgi:hypothetical protein